MCLPNATLPQPISVALWCAYGFIRGVPIHFQPIHLCICLHSRIATLPTITASQTLLHKGVAFKASSIKLGSAIQRVMSNSIAYRHTSERITQHYYIQRANFYISFVHLFIYTK
jgi:hypothetical protein